MKSIRRQLTLWLSGGLLVLWIGAGAGIYEAVRSGLIKTLDAELAVDKEVTRQFTKLDQKSDPLRDLLRNPDAQSGKGFQGKRPSPRFLEYQQPDSGSYYQLWSSKGVPSEQSGSLGEMELPFPGEVTQEPSFATVVTNNGTKLRTMSFRAGSGNPKGKGNKSNRSRDQPNSIVSIAHDMGDIDQTLSTLLGGLIVVGLLAAGGTFILVGTSLKQGLKPLRQLGEQTTSIDVRSLDARFDGTKAPFELQPVYGRLNELMERIQNSFDRERRFSADLAHEIRTPIAELKMMSEVALKWPEQTSSETFSDYLDIAQQLETMVESLLALARWESGEVELKIESVNLEALSRSCWEPFSDSSAQKNHRILFDFDEVATIESDPSLLKHVISNLLSNATEYTAENGEITISSLNGELAVSNRPHGLSDDDISQLFDRYWRRDAARSDSSHVGLGLSLARSCAEALGLELSVESRNGWLVFKISEITSES